MDNVPAPFRRTQVAIAALFFLLGFQYATWASRLPEIKTRSHLSTSEIGWLLLACGAGAAASYPLVTFLMRKLGSRRLACGSAVGLGLCLLALMSTQNYPAILVIMCVDGVLCACLDVAMNAQGAMLEEESHRTTMAKLHATFSAGSLCAALLTSGISRATSSLSVHFGLVTVILLALVGYAWPRLLSGDPQPSTARRGLFMPSRMALLLGGAMAFATITEGAMNDWSTLYLKDVVNVASALAPSGIAVFSAAMIVARLFADGWRARWGDRRVVLVGCAVAAFGLSLGVLLGGVVPALLGFASVGLGIAPATPCIYVAAARQGPSLLPLVAAMGVTGMLAGPPVIGSIADVSNLAWGMGAVALFAVAVSVCAMRTGRASWQSGSR